MSYTYFLKIYLCYDEYKGSDEKMQIVRITTQKKNNERYNIFITDGQEEKYGFSVDESVLIENNLRKGLELEQSFIKRLKEEDNYYKSYSLAIHYLSYRMRTKQEIYDYLVKKEVEEQHIPEVIKRLVDKDLLDDRAFAEAFVGTRINTSSKGPELIKRELIEKGVAASIAEEAVKVLTYEVQFDKAMSWAQKKLNTSQKESFQKQQQKLRANLMRKGFTQDVINDVITEVKAEQAVGSEWDALVYQGDKLIRKHEQKLDGFELQQKIKEGLYRQGFSFDLINKYLDEVSTTI